MTSATETSSSRSVSSRLLAVLDTFDAGAGELTLSEISRRSGQPLPTTHRFVGELVRWGALERGASGGYRIGAKLWELASRAPRTEGLRQAALPVLNDLAAATGLTVRLAIAGGPDVLCVEVIARGVQPAVSQRPGCRLPLHATAVGKAVLACSSAALLRSVLDAGMCRYTPYTLPAGLLVRSLDRIRAGEVAQAREEHRLGEIELALPVRQPGDQVAALGMLWGTRPPSLPRVTALLQTARTALEDALATQASDGWKQAAGRSRPDAYRQ